MLEERVTKDIEQFSMSLQSYYDNLIKNGRSVKLHIRRWSGWEYDLDSEFGGEPLIDIIDEWMARNALMVTIISQEVPRMWLPLNKFRFLLSMTGGVH